MIFLPSYTLETFEIASHLYFLNSSHSVKIAIATESFKAVKWSFTIIIKLFNNNCLKDKFILIVLKNIINYVLKMINLPSPCISICKLNKSTGFCDGCFRTINEISQWPSMTDVERMSLLETLRQRQGIKRRLNRRRKNNKSI